MERMQSRENSLDLCLSDSSWWGVLWQIDSKGKGASEPPTRRIAPTHCFSKRSHTMKCVARHEYPWAVNYPAVGRDGTLAAVVGDATEAWVVDTRSGKLVQTCEGHLDFSFAAAWQPCAPSGHSCAWPTTSNGSGN